MGPAVNSFPMHSPLSAHATHLPRPVPIQRNRHGAHPSTNKRARDGERECPLLAVLGAPRAENAREAVSRRNAVVVNRGEAEGGHDGPRGQQREVEGKQEVAQPAVRRCTQDVQAECEEERRACCCGCGFGCALRSVRDFGWCLALPVQGGGACDGREGITALKDEPPVVPS
jgi:hypothetical protein